MQDIAPQAVREYIENHSRAELLDRVIDEELPRYAGALERLGHRYLTLAELPHVAERAPGSEVPDRCSGLCHVHRPWPWGATRLPAWKRWPQRCCIRWHATKALVNGNKRLALAATIAFFGINGRRPTITNDEAYELVIEVTSRA